VPGRLQLGTGPDTPVVVLSPATKLYPHHLNPRRAFDYSTVLAELVENPRVPGEWGLRNLTGATWTFTDPDGGPYDVPPGRAVPLVDGRTIAFGAVNGQIHA